MHTYNFLLRCKHYVIHFHLFEFPPIHHVDILVTPMTCKCVSPTEIPFELLKQLHPEVTKTMHHIKFKL